MVKTIVHAHSPSREAIHAAVEKVTGGSLFAGTFNDNVWCDTFGARL
ncbi:MAG: glycosyl hydrolase [Microbacteriaceae bacterium]|jgi:beta-N-acetylhexosaminidase|nr:glycosyl hydrolase [Microbacteriaceae bacterium]